MPSTPANDHRFLSELINRLDAEPGDRITGADIAAAIGLPNEDAQPTVQRLKARGFIDWSPAPSRGGDGWTSRGLAVTPDGYKQVNTGLTPN